MNELADALSWNGSDVVSTLFVISEVGGTAVEVPTIDPAPKRIGAFELVDERRALEGRTVVSYDLTWDSVPAKLHTVVERCLVEALEHGAVLAWFGFEGSFDFEYILHPEVADQIYGVGSCVGVELALDDAVRASQEWTQRLTDHRRALRPNGP